MKTTPNIYVKHFDHIQKTHITHTENIPKHTSPPPNNTKLIQNKHWINISAGRRGGSGWGSGRRVRREREDDGEGGRWRCRTSHALFGTLRCRTMFNVSSLNASNCKSEPFTAQCFKAKCFNSQCFDAEFFKAQPFKAQWFNSQCFDAQHFKSQCFENHQPNCCERWASP